MQTTLLLSSNSRSTAGVLLLTLVAVEYGGWFMPPCRLVCTVAFDGEGLRDREASVPLRRAVLR